MEESKVKRAEWKICQADLMIGLFRERQLITELWKPANNARREAICIKDSGSIEERNSKVQISVLICICRNSNKKKRQTICMVWFVGRAQCFLLSSARGFRSRWISCSAWSEKTCFPAARMGCWSLHTERQKDPKHDNDRQVGIENGVN